MDLSQLSEGEGDYDLTTRNDISYILSGLSVLGALYIFTIFFSFKRIRRKVLYQLVFNISLADFIGIVAGTYVPASYGEGDPTNSEQDICNIAAVFVTYGNLSGLFWSVSFGYKIYQLIIKEKSPTELNRLKWSYFCCMGIPAILCGSVVLTQVIGNWALLGYNVTYCWLLPVEGVTGDRYYALIASYSLVYYVPVLIAVLSNIVLYLKIFQILRKLKLQFKWPFMFLIYPFLLLICSVPAIVDRTFMILDPDSSAAVILHYVHVGLMQVHGLLNAIIYGINPEVKDEVKKLMTNCKSRKKRNLNALLQSLRETNERETNEASDDNIEDEQQHREDWVQQN